MNKIREWVLILGGSSGIGLATAQYLAKRNYPVIIVHKDRRSRMKNLEIIFNAIRAENVDLITINSDATNNSGIEKSLDTIKSQFTKNDKIKLLLHSVADGNTQLINEKSVEEMEDAFNHTIQAMGISFVKWARRLLDLNLFTGNARIIGLTSEGAYRYIEAYSQIGTAKAVLENVCRSMAIEFARYNITSNIISPGITDTKALKALPEYEYLIKSAKNKNPFKRLTTPDDIAKVIWLMLQEEAGWINGEIIRVDGGEQIVY